MVGGDSPRHGCFPLACARRAALLLGHHHPDKWEGARVGHGRRSIGRIATEPSGVDSWPPGGLPLARRYMRVNVSLSLVVRRERLLGWSADARFSREGSGPGYFAA